MPKELPHEQTMKNQRQFSEALQRWNSSIEPLEAMLAPYFNYHYASAPSALVGQLRKSFQSFLATRGWSGHM